MGSPRKTVRSSEEQDESTSSCEGEDTNSEPASEHQAEEEAEEEVESWVGWLMPTTGLAEDELRKAGTEDRVLQQRRNYWKWCGHITRLMDHRWTVKVLNWNPTEGSRRPGHPEKRWRDDIDKYIANVARGRGQRQCGT